MALKHTSFQSSTYMHLTALATQVNIELGRQQLSWPKTQGSASNLNAVLARAQLASSPLLRTPAALTYGSAIQLQALFDDQVQDVPYYAVSEEVFEYMLPSASTRDQTFMQTKFDGSLLAVISLQGSNMLTCPSTHSASSPQHQRHDHGKLPVARLREDATQLATEAQRPHLSWLPWTVSLCLLATTIAMAISSTQPHHGRQAFRHVQITAEPSIVKSNRPFMDPTPTKDTGCSPFVPVTQAPVPQWPHDNAYLASCSSKIGSYKQKARPASSRAVTNMTSNVSGATKWQRNKNGRLLSLELDPDEHNS